MTLGPLHARSLIGRTLLQVALRIGAVVAVASLLGYWHVREAVEAQALQQLATYVDERRARESGVFVLAADHLRTFARHFPRDYAGSLEQVPEAVVDDRFTALFEQRPDAAWRVRREVFERFGVTGAIGRYAAVDSDLKRRLVVAFDALVRFGNAWQEQSVNLYVITPEHAVLMFWPDQPWALQAADWEIFGKLALVSPSGGGVVVVDPEVAAPADSGWSDLYFDYAVRDWLVSATEPVTLDGRLLLLVGSDILLNDLFQRTLTGGIPGTYAMILREEGQLIAHPRLMEAIQANGGALPVAATQDAHLARILELARGVAGDRAIVANPGDHEHLAVTHLQDVGWSLVTVFPERIIAEQAFVAARVILLLGAAALLLEIGILYLTLRNRVSRPLQQLVQATRKIASGQRAEAIEIARDDELGELARSFDVMAHEIAARETALSERSETLALLNARLERELAERHRMEGILARQRDALHQSEKMKAMGSLLAGIAHELNNPLSVVVGRSVLLEERLRETTQHGAALKLRAAAERCARIIRTFLAMARQQAPERRRVDMGEVIESSLELVSSRLRSSGVGVSVTVEPGLPAVSGDAGQLGQVISNLLLNAQQALADVPGERRICIAAGTDRSEGTVVVRVADTGPGVPAEIRHRIFEPFFTTKPLGVGTGMGLSVCYRIIEGHGGTLRLEPAGAGGATFVITLPKGPNAENETGR